MLEVVVIVCIWLQWLSTCECGYCLPEGQNQKLLKNTLVQKFFQFAKKSPAQKDWIPNMDLA